jgi:bacteriorhodopsin
MSRIRLSMAFLAVGSSAADLYRWRWYSISVLYTSLLTVSLSYTKK